MAAKLQKIEYIQLNRQSCLLNVGVNAEFAVDQIVAVANGFRADVENVGNIIVADPTKQQTQNLKLPYR